MARPIWKGSISFGLVSIPVQLQTAVREKSISFHMLSSDGSCRLRRKLYCPETGEEFDFGDTARGIEVGKDQYVLVDEKEIDQIKPEKGRTIEIEQFVRIEEIDPIYFDRPYYVTPAEGSSKAYKLLHAAMSDAGTIGIARFIMRDRQNLAALRIMGEGIVLHTLNYADEVLPIEDALPSAMTTAKPAAKEVQIAHDLIEAMTHPLKLDQFKDEFREKLQDLIDAKRRGRKTVEVSDYHEDDDIPPTINLMDALKRSLAANRSPRNAARHPRRKSA